MAREGFGETRPRTGRAAEDRQTGSGAPDNDAGSGSGRHERGRSIGREPRRHEPLPTRVSDVPRLPESFDATLRAGVSALGLEFGAEEREAIEAHVRLLLTWTRAINLTAIRDPEAVARDHVLDSLAAVAVLRDRGIRRFVDLGSGGGFPGLPLAIVLPARRALLVESVGKKARFLEVAVVAAGLSGRVRVFADRAETLAGDPAERGSWPAVVVRAVADLAELVELSFPLLRIGGILVAWKRRATLNEEVAWARSALAAVGGGSIDMLPSGVPSLEDHRLVIATKAGPTPPKFPRPPAERRRRPWRAM